MDMTNYSVLYFLVRLSELKDYAYSGINMYSVRKNTEDLLVMSKMIVPEVNDEQKKYRISRLVRRNGP
jgi:hypothetical protein